MSTKSLSGKRSVLLKLLYFALVRSILEYGSTIWNPYSKTDIDIIEHVQNRFLKFVAFKLNLSIDNNDYTQIGLINGVTDSPDLSSYFPFNIPAHNNRSTPFFRYSSTCSTNYLKNLPRPLWLYVMNSRK